MPTPNPQTLDALEEVVENTIATTMSDTHIQSLKEHLNRAQFVREYCTIRIALPRRLGNSTLALRLLYKYDNSYLVTLSMHHVRNFLEASCDMSLDASNEWARHRIFGQMDFSHNQSWQCFRRGVSSDPVVFIVDPYTDVSTHRNLNIDSIMYGIPVDFIVLIG